MVISCNKFISDINELARFKVEATIHNESCCFGPMAPLCSDTTAVIISSNLAPIDCVSANVSINCSESRILTNGNIVYVLDIELVPNTTAFIRNIDFYEALIIQLSSLCFGQEYIKINISTGDCDPKYIISSVSLGDPSYMDFSRDPDVWMLWQYDGLNNIYAITYVNILTNNCCSQFTNRVTSVIYLDMDQSMYTVVPIYNDVLLTTHNKIIVGTDLPTSGYRFDFIDWNSLLPSSAMLVSYLGCGIEKSLLIQFNKTIPVDPCVPSPCLPINWIFDGDDVALTAEALSVGASWTSVGADLIINDLPYTFIGQILTFGIDVMGIDVCCTQPSLKVSLPAAGIGSNYATITYVGNEFNGATLNITQQGYLSTAYQNEIDVEVKCASSCGSGTIHKIKINAVEPTCSCIDTNGDMLFAQVEMEDNGPFVPITWDPTKSFSINTYSTNGTSIDPYKVKHKCFNLVGNNRYSSTTLESISTSTIITTTSIPINTFTVNTGIPNCNCFVEIDTWIECNNGTISNTKQSHAVRKLFAASMIVDDTDINNFKCNFSLYITSAGISYTTTYCIMDYKLMNIDGHSIKINNSYLANPDISFELLSSMGAASMRALLAAVIGIPIRVTNFVETLYESELSDVHRNSFIDFLRANFGANQQTIIPLPYYNASTVERYFKIFDGAILFKISKIGSLYTIKIQCSYIGNNVEILYKIVTITTITSPYINGAFNLETFDPEANVQGIFITTGEVIIETGLGDLIDKKYAIYINARINDGGNFDIINAPFTWESFRLEVNLQGLEF